MKFVRKGVNIWLLAIVGLFTVAAVAIACGDGDTTTMEPDPDPTPAPMPGPSPDPDPTPAPGGTFTSDGRGTLTIGIPEDVTGSNPWNNLGDGSTAYNIAVFGNRYGALYGLSDTKNQYYPTIAADYPAEFERVGDTWVSTVTLRDDITWSDGEKLDAEDVVYTLEVAREFGLSGNWSTYLQANFLDDLEVVAGENAVRYTLKALDEDGEVQNPGLSVWQYGILAAPIYAEHYWRPKVEAITPMSCGDDDGGCQDDRRTALTDLDVDGEPIIGPVNFDEWRQGAFVGLSRSSDSYLEDSSLTLRANGAVEETVLGETNEWLVGTQPGSAGDVDLEFDRSFDIENTIFQVFSNQNAAVLALREGEIDYFLSPLGLSQGLLNQLEGQDGVAITNNESNGFRYLSWNFEREPFNDLAFRQAFAVLVDRDQIAAGIFGGVVDAVYTVVPKGNGFWYNPDVTEFGRKMNPDGSTKLNDDGEPERLTRQERMEEAIRILKAAGYTWEVEPTWDMTARRIIEGEGLRKPDGTPITQRTRKLADGTLETIDGPLELLSPSSGYDPFRATTALLIEQWMNEMGIPVRARLRGFNEIVQAIAPVTDDGLEQLRDFDMYILGWSLGTYPNFLVSFFSEETTGPGGQNRAGFVNEEYEVQAKKFREAQDPEVAREAAFEMQRILSVQLPYITLFAAPIREAYRSDRVEFAYTEVLDGLNNLFSDPGGPLARAIVAE